VRIFWALMAIWLAGSSDVHFFIRIVCVIGVLLVAYIRYNQELADAWTRVEEILAKRRVGCD